MIAIETRYRGYRFRSRLEARWAVFFDSLGLDWEYEPEGYDLGDAGWYLPDFWIDSLDLWVEVKSCASMITRESIEKAEKISDGCFVAIVAGKSPCGDLLDWEGKYGDEVGCVRFTPNFQLNRGHVRALYAAEVNDGGGGQTWTGFDFCNYVGGEESLIIPDWVYDGSRERKTFHVGFGSSNNRVLSMPEGRKAPMVHFRHTLKAAKIARSARFEHGESPL